MTTLVLVAHPDDETLGAGGWLRKMADAGEPWYAISVCAPAARRQKPYQFADACSILGGAGFGGLPSCYADQTLASYACEHITYNVRVLIDALPAAGDIHRFDRIITHGPYDLNDDHRKVFEAAMVLTRPPWKGELYTMYIPSSTEWAFGQFGDFRPNTFVEVSGDPVAAKSRAWKCYDTEQRDPPHSRNWWQMVATMRHFGAMVGIELAEPFQLVKRVV